MLKVALPPQRTYITLSLLFFSLLTFSEGFQVKAVACHVPPPNGHDCVNSTGRANFRDLPYRIAQHNGFFQDEKVFPTLHIGADGDAERLTSIAQGNVLLGIASAFELPRLVRSNDQVKIVAVLQTKPSISLLARNPAIIRLDNYFGIGSLSMRDYNDSGMDAVLVGRTDRLRAEQDGVSAILRALSHAVLWMYDAANRAEVTDFIRTTYDVDGDSASLAYGALIQDGKAYSTTLSPQGGVRDVTNRWLYQTGEEIAAGSIDLSYLRAAGLLR